MAKFLYGPVVQFLDNNGDPLSGGKVTIYAAGTTTEVNSYPTIADANAATNANANPVILDSRGEATIVVTQSVKVKLDDSSDNNIWTEDNVDLFDGGTNQFTTIVDTNQNESIKITATASAVNHIDVVNAATTNDPAINATGDDTNVSLSLGAKGTGVVKVSANFDTNGNDIIIDDTKAIEDDSNNEYIEFSKTASAVNQIDIANAATGNGPTISTSGDDTNIDLVLDTKGTGNITPNSHVVLGTSVNLDFQNNNLIANTSSKIQDENGNELLMFDPQGSAVNYFEILNAATGSPPDLKALGDDTNIGLKLTPKGTGNVTIGGSGTLVLNSGVDLQMGGTDILDSNGNEEIIFSATGSAVNEITITNAATANGPTIASSGDDTNVDLNIDAKGTGSIVLGANLDLNGSEIIMDNSTAIEDTNNDPYVLFESSGSAVNYIRVGNANTSNAPYVKASGSDTNVDLDLRGQGAGSVVISESALNLDSPTELTIATGVVNATQSFHTIDTESDAASDDLDTIGTNGSTGDILIITAANAARTVVAKDGTGNLQLAGDFSMDNTHDTLTLIRSGSNWLELCRSNNSA